MSHPDARDNPCSSSHAAARDAAEQALWRMMSFYDTPLADLDRAIAEDPGWVLPHIMKAGFLLSLTEAPLLPEAQAHLTQAGALMRHATPREKAHLEAVQMVHEGRWQVACRVWDELLVDHPAVLHGKAQRVGDVVLHGLTPLLPAGAVVAVAIARTAAELGFNDQVAA